MSQYSQPAPEEPVITNQPSLKNLELPPEENIKAVTIQPSFSDSAKLPDANGETIDDVSQFKPGMNGTTEEDLKKEKQQVERVIQVEPKVVERQSYIFCFSCYDPYPWYCNCCNDCEGCCCSSDAPDTTQAVNDDGCCDCGGDNEGCCDCGDCDCGDCDCGDCDCGDCDCGGCDCGDCNCL